MQEDTRREIARLERAVQKVAADVETHAREDLLIHKHTDEVLEDIRSEARTHYREVEEGIKLMQGMYQRAQDDFSERLNTQDTNVNNRISGSTAILTKSMNDTVISFRDTLTMMIKAVSDAVTTHVTVQTDINKTMAERQSKMDDRIWSLLRVAYGTLITLLVAIIGSLIAKAVHWI